MSDHGVLEATGEVVNGNPVVNWKKPNGETFVGTAHPAIEGKPLPPNVKAILTYETTSNPNVVRVTNSASIRSRPTSAAYRANYDTIFGVKKPS